MSERTFRNMSYTRSSRRFHIRGREVIGDVESTAKPFHAAAATSDSLRHAADHFVNHKIADRSTD